MDDALMDVLLFTPMMDAPMMDRRTEADEWPRGRRMWMP